MVCHVLMDPNTEEHNKPVTAGTLLLRENHFFTCGYQSGNIYFGGRVNQSKKVVDDEKLMYFIIRYRLLGIDVHTSDDDHGRYHRFGPVSFWRHRRCYT
jgi:hypothetical protein